MDDRFGKRSLRLPPPRLTPCSPFHPPLLLRPSFDYRRQSTGSPAPLSSSIAGPVVKKPKALSGQKFLDLFQTVVDLDEKYRSCIGVVEAIPPSYLDESSTDIDDLVGDELTDMYKKVCQAERNVRRERRTMYSIAVRRRDSEAEARRYVSWLRNLAKADDDDIDFCDKLETKLDLISVCHGKLNYFCQFLLMHHIFFPLRQHDHFLHTPNQQRRLSRRVTSTARMRPEGKPMPKRPGNAPRRMRSADAY